MALHVYDPMTRTKREFQPIHPGKVGMYVCGMTVQDKPHLGHMFAFVAVDMVRRYLEYLGYDVTHVQNFTDVDDKIIARALEEGVDYRVVAERNMALYHEFARALNIMPAHRYPLATEHIPEIVAFIEKLVAKNHAYASGGDVWFDVRSFSDYGALSGRNVDELRSGVRVEVDEGKRDPLDFALWKEAKPGEPAWDSPWGRGRPGWHIECSVMSTQYLGDHFDFHGGGRDLIFPHHENERAQSCCGTEQPFVNFWLHNGLLYLGDKKMSKSDGNFFAMGEIFADFAPEVVRFFLLNAHFRSQVDYSAERLREAQAAYERLRRGAQRLLEKLDAPVDPVPADLVSQPGETLEKAIAEHRRRFFAAMDDDFNSAGAIGALFGLVKDLNQYHGSAGPELVDRDILLSAKEFMALGVDLLGLHPAGLSGLAAGGGDVPDEVRSLAAARDEARRARDWARADSLRDEILKLGFIVEDGAEGSVLRPVGSSK